MATGIQAEMACTESRSDYDSDKYSHLHCSEVAPAIRRLIIIGPFHIMCPFGLDHRRPWGLVVVVRSPFPFLADA